MAHLYKLGLENFRLFKEMTEFDLAPITLLTGVNNSGKSSLIKSLLLLKDSFKDSKKLSKLLFSENKQNLGTFTESINDQNKEKEFIKFRIKLPINFFDDEFYVDLEYVPHSTFRENGDLISFRISNKDNRELILFHSLLNLRGLEKKVRGIVIDKTNSKLNSLKVDINFFADLIADYKNSKYKPDNSDNLAQDIAASKDMVSEVNLVDEFWSTPWNQEELKEEFENYKIAQNSAFNYFFTSQGNESVLNELEGINVNEPLLVIIDSNGKEIIPDTQILESLQSRISSLAEEDHVIGYQLVDEPKTTLDWYLYFDLVSSFNIRLNLNDSCKIITSKFGYFVFNTFLKNYIEKSFSEIKNHFTNINSLSSLRANTERLYYNTSEIVDINSIIIQFIEANILRNKLIKEFINNSLKLFNIGDQISIERHQGVASEIFIHKGNKKKLLADLGFGFTQLLPIIMKVAIIAVENMKLEDNSPAIFNPSVLLLEEPESNLHPSYQSKLADLIVDAARKFNIQFIIETHSEYLIRKFQYLTAQKELRSKDICIYYFHEPNSVPQAEKQVRKIEIQDDGILSNEFGSGFFDEADNLATQLFVLNKNASN
jgi:predicted ATPase